MKQKKCPQCKNNKTADCYWENKHSTDGLSSYCKVCFNAIRRYKRQNNIGYWGDKEKRGDKMIVLEHYGEKCCKCGFSDWRTLSIDHINSDGAEHRKKVSGAHIYRWLKNNNFPTGFQILCMNCQFIKRHEKKEFYKPKKDS